MSKKVLVIANETCAGRELLDTLREHAAGAEVLVVAPALNSRLRHILADVDKAREAAEERLTASIPKTFRIVHWATYLLWPTALLHALGSGTDAGTMWFRALAVACAGSVIAAVAWRTAPSFAGRGWVRHQRRTA